MFFLLTEAKFDVFKGVENKNLNLVKDYFATNYNENRIKINFLP